MNAAKVAIDKVVLYRIPCDLYFAFITCILHCSTQREFDDNL